MVFIGCDAVQDWIVPGLKMSDAEGARSPDQLNKFEKLTHRPPHGETLAGRLTTLARHANAGF